mmetsp:Transcript_3005/g.6097  ORF Transcript_3005/g.6097 Transcript_3005/m.6097 type:complete len:343 (+) Transcript_3005:315-1343(+)
MGCGVSSSNNVAGPTPSLSKIPQNTVWSHYQVGPTIGIGQFAVVRSCEHKVTGDKVAIKSIKRSTDTFDMDLIREEIEVMQGLKHPGCIALLETFKQADAIHLVQERGKEDLWDRIAAVGPMSTPIALDFTKQILDGLSYLHEQNVCHRDLKPENIIMMGTEPREPGYYTAKIADFGFSTRKMRGYFNTMHTVQGTPEFSAPELLKMMLPERCATMSGFDQPTRYNAKVDVWAVGAILFSMLAGEKPFEFQGNLPTLIQRIMRGKLDFSAPVWDKISEDTKLFVLHLMTVLAHRLRACTLVCARRICGARVIRRVCQNRVWGPLLQEGGSCSFLFACVNLQW